MAATNPALRRLLPWAVVTAALVALAVVVGAVRYDALPDPYPTHFGPTGSADSFGDKSVVTVFTPVLIGLLSAVVVLAVAGVTARRAPAVAAPLAALGCAIGGGSALLATVQYLSDEAIAPGWVFWIYLALILAATVWVVLAAMRAERAAGARSPKEAQHWKWGLVYVNGDDERVFVPKRVGTGVSVNFGRPMGWVVMALILVPAVAVVLWAATLG